MVWQSTKTEGQIRLNSTENNQDREVKPEIEHEIQHEVQGVMAAISTTMYYQMSSPI